MLLFLFIDNWLIPFNSCSDCTKFYSYFRTLKPTGTQTNAANTKTEGKPVTVVTKIRLWFVSSKR